MKISKIEFDRVSTPGGEQWSSYELDKVYDGKVCTGITIGEGSFGEVAIAHFSNGIGIAIQKWDSADFVRYTIEDH